jgi:hypothetical protein
MEWRRPHPMNKRQHLAPFIAIEQVVLYREKGRPVLCSLETNCLINCRADDSTRWDREPRQIKPTSLSPLSVSRIDVS